MYLTWQPFSVWTSCVSTLSSHLGLMATILDSSDLAENCPGARISETQRSLESGGPGSTSACPFVAEVHRRPLVGAVVNKGEQFSHPRVRGSNKKGWGKKKKKKERLGRRHERSLGIEWGLRRAVHVGKGILGRAYSLGRGQDCERAQCSWRITGSSFSSTRVLGMGGPRESRGCRGGLDLPPLAAPALVIHVPNISYFRSGRSLLTHLPVSTLHPTSLV